jgi:hypothetical protein
MSSVLVVVTDVLLHPNCGRTVGINFSYSFQFTELLLSSQNCC